MDRLDIDTIYDTTYNKYRRQDNVKIGKTIKTDLFLI